MAASGSAIRVMSEPKIEIVAADQTRTNAGCARAARRTDCARWRSIAGVGRPSCEALRYTPPASVRQNPRTTRPSTRVASPIRSTTRQESRPGPCSTPSASACARRSAA